MPAAVAPGTTIEISSERFARELDLNLVGAHRLVRTFVPGMVERRRGDIVFVSSDVAVRPRPFMAAYSASKWGLEGMVNALQMELEGTGVRASIVRPGPTWSEHGRRLGSRRGRVRARPVGHASASRGIRTSSRPRRTPTRSPRSSSAPRGVHLSLLDVNPEAPVEE